MKTVKVFYEKTIRVRRSFEITDEEYQNIVLDGNLTEDMVDVLEEDITYAEGYLSFGDIETDWSVRDEETGEVIVDWYK